jgi:hypothetical protein
MSLDENPYKSPEEAGEPVSAEADKEAPGEKRMTALDVGVSIGCLAGFLGGCVVALIVILKTWLPAFSHLRELESRSAPFLLFLLVVPFGLLILVTFVGILAGAVVGRVVATARALISWLQRATRGH